MARSFVSVRFADLPNLRYFSHNGNAYQKRSSRTAYLIQYDRTFNFSRGERVEPITSPVVNGMTREQVATAAKHFVIAALWADKEEGTHPRATRECYRVAEQFVRDFSAQWPDLVAAALAADGYGSHPDAGSPAAAFGHDLYLSCAGHGVGFSDRVELADKGDADRSIGDRLSDVIRQDWRRWYVNAYAYRGWFVMQRAEPIYPQGSIGAHHE